MSPLPYPPEVLSRTSTGLSERDVFEAVGREFLGYFREFCRLRPNHRVLDVGCGVGRMARQLTDYLSDRGAYCGFDVHREQIQWCQREITPRFPNFKFQHVDVANTTYNDGGGVSGEYFTFPYPSRAFDLVVIASVFTHMMPAAVRRYLAETARVLRPGGCAIVTYFLLTETMRGRAGAAYQFPHAIEPNSVWVEDAQHPEDVVGYEERYIERCYDAVGLKIKALRYGRWSGLRNAPLSGQDIVVARKRWMPALRSR